MDMFPDGSEDLNDDSKDDDEDEDEENVTIIKTMKKQLGFGKDGKDGKSVKQARM